MIEVASLPIPYNFNLDYLTRIVNGDFTDRLEQRQAEWHVKALTDESLKVIELDKSLVSLIESTDNELFYRPLFASMIFINQNFKINTDFLCGIFVYDVPITVDSPEHTWTISALWRLADGRYLWECGNPFSKEMVEIHGMDRHLAKPTRFSKSVTNIVCNIVDFVENNTDDVRVVEIKTDRRRNEKRMAGGKYLVPTKVFIKPKPHFVQYAQEFSERSEKQASHKWLVRGHWRHYRAERYSPKLRAQPKWIKPFFKGEGILIQKPFVLQRE